MFSFNHRISGSGKTCINQSSTNPILSVSPFFRVCSSSLVSLLWNDRSKLVDLWYRTKLSPLFPARLLSRVRYRNPTKLKDCCKHVLVKRRSLWKREEKRRTERERERERGREKNRREWVSFGISIGTGVSRLIRRRLGISVHTRIYSIPWFDVDG